MHSVATRGRWRVLLCIGTVHVLRVVDLEEGVCERSERAVVRVHRRDEADMYVVQVVEDVLVVEADLAVIVLVEPFEVVLRLWSRGCVRVPVRVRGRAKVRVRVRARVRVRVRVRV